MAASGYSPISLYYSSTASAVPTNTNLVNGELAINIADGKLYYKDSGGTVQLLSTSTTANGTANGVLYLNGSKVATSGSALTFDGTTFVAPSIQSTSSTASLIRNADNSYITISGATTYANGAALLLSGNGYAAASQAFLDANQSVFRSAGGGTEYMRLTSTGLGIGTSSPAGKLSVKPSDSQLDITGAATAIYLEGINRANMSAQVDMGYYARNGNHIWNNGAYTERMRLDTSGNLGIGTSSPQFKLQVAGTNGSISVTGSGYTTSPVGMLLGQYSSSKVYIQKPNGYALSFWDGGTNDQMLLDSSGNLGLGVTPSAWRTDYSQRALQFSFGSIFGLRVSGSDNRFAFSNNTYQDSAGNYVYMNDGYATQYMTSGGAHSWLTAGSGTAGGTITFTQAMTLDASGNLGIGTTLQNGPKLNVMGGDIVPATSGSTQNGGLRVSSLNSGGGGYVLDMGVSNTNGYAWMQVSNSQNLASGFTKDLVLQPNGGNLGLGVTPSAWSALVGLQVKNAAVYGFTDEAGLNSNSYYNAGWKYISSNYATSYSQYNGAHRWFNAASGNAGDTITFTQAMTLDASGRLGIGVTSPSFALDITQSAAGRVVNINSTAANGGGLVVTSSGTDVIQFGSYKWNYGTGNATDGSIYANSLMAFGTNGTERARIDSSGNLMVGTTSTGYSDTSSASSEASAGRFIANHVTGASSGSLYVGFGYAGSGIGSITQNGTTAVAYNTSSDYRLKDNQAPLTNSGAFIDALQPKTWTWKADGSNGVGFIAHEVQEVSPNSVVGEKDAVDEEGKPIMQAMEYGSAEFIANIIAELQSLRARVAQLESK